MRIPDQADRLSPIGEGPVADQGSADFPNQRLADVVETGRTMTMLWTTCAPSTSWVI